MATVSTARTTRTPRTANPFVPPPPAPKVEAVEKVREVQTDNEVMLANLLLAKIADGSMKDIKLVVGQPQADGKITLSLRMSIQLPLEVKLS